MAAATNCTGGVRFIRARASTRSMSTWRKTVFTASRARRAAMCSIWWQQWSSAVCREAGEKRYRTGFGDKPEAALDCRGVVLGDSRTGKVDIQTNGGPQRSKKKKQVGTECANVSAQRCGSQSPISSAAGDSAGDGPEAFGARVSRKGFDERPGCHSHSQRAGAADRVCRALDRWQ